MAGPVSRPGRDLERLVATVERSLGAGPIVVKSPEFILGRNSDTMREVDVSVRGKIGSADIFVMVECRDRSRPATVQWIDEVVGKAADVGASKVVLVSANGFSTTARDYAEGLGIEIRDLEELSSLDVLGWVAEAFRSVILVRRRVEILHVTVDLGTDAREIQPIDGSPPAVPSEAQVFRRTSDGSMATTRDAWMTIDQEQIYRETGRDRRRVDIRARFPNSDERFEIRVRSDWFEVEEMHVVADVWLEVEEPPVKPFRYSKGGVIVSEGLSWDWDLGHGPVRAALTRTVDDEGRAQITYSAEPRPEPTVEATPTPPFDFGDTDG